MMGHSPKLHNSPFRTPVPSRITQDQGANFQLSAQQPSLPLGGTGRNSKLEIRPQRTRPHLHRLTRHRKNLNANTERVEVGERQTAAGGGEEEGRS